MLLSLKNVSFKYPTSPKATLNNINLDVTQGKITAIVGKSGSGKTTLLSLLAGLGTATSGEITIDGKNLKSINRSQYRSQNIGVVFQNFNLLANATAMENMLLSMNISGVTGNKVEIAKELLGKVGIDEVKASRKVLKLSGGEQQRVSIARAIAHNPNIIIADEPTANLDKKTQEDILKILTHLAYEENRMVIVVTHSKQVATLADEVWELKKGSLSKASEITTQQSTGKARKTKGRR